jgi:CRISPR-associated endoribonuclease Cas6
MRFLVRLVNVSEEPAIVDVDYRKRFISLLKKVFGEEEFRKPTTRPYTFAVFFGREAKIDGTKITGVKFINLRFSSGDSVAVARFYNGILKLKKGGYVHSIGTGKFRIEHVKEEKEKQPKGIFKTLSPVIVERMGFSELKNPAERYVVPSEEGFTESLLENILRRYGALTGRKLEVSKFSFESVNIEEKLVKHYRGILKGFIGRFKIITDSQELINFIYRYGIGMRTGQGFGYLEVEDGKA